MKKILSLFLALCFIFMITACDVENQTAETTTTNNKPYYSEITSTSSGNIDEETNIRTFTATVTDNRSILIVRTDDPDMLRCADIFELYLPDGFSADDFSVGDVIEITFRGPILEVSPARIPDVITIRHISRQDRSEQVEFFARILSVQGHSLYVHGDAKAFGMYSGYAHLPKNVSAEDHQKGDYVAITFPGLIMESYPPQINVTAIRPLTETEMAKLPEEEEQRIRLQYMGKDETKLIGVCMDRAYAIFLTEFENIPDMTFGDHFTVVYEEALPGVEPTQLLFIKALYLSDENGEPIE